MKKNAITLLFDENEQLIQAKNDLLSGEKPFDLNRLKELENSLKIMQSKENKLYKAVDSICNRHNAGRLELVLDSKKYGNTLSVFDYFKKELEKETNSQLVLYKYVTKFHREQEVFEDWAWYHESQTLVDELLLPESVANKVFELTKELTLKQYNQLLKQSPYAYVLKREWVDGKIIPSNIKEISPSTYRMDLSVFGFMNNKNFFKEDIYNKENENFNRAIIYSLAYWDEVKTMENKKILDIIEKN